MPLLLIVQFEDRLVLGLVEDGEGFAEWGGFHAGICVFPDPKFKNQ